jgi:hypothetical protein
MSITQKYPSHSAEVRMQLSANGHSFPISHLGPEFVILKNPVDLPPTEAEITLSIDGRVRRWLVHLPEGIAAGRQRTKLGD